MTPSIGGDLAADRVALRDHATRADDLIATLPPVPERSPEQQTTARDAHRSCRWVRSRFMRAHAEQVYVELTDEFTTRRRPSDLALAAASAFPGLVPTESQLDAERDLQQAEKEGREVDQGIFFHELLRADRSGQHLVETALRPTDRAVSLLPAFQEHGAIDLDSVRIERRDGIAHVTLRNLHCLNAEDNVLMADLEAAVDLVLLDDATGVGVLRGAAMTHPRYAGRRVFSAGINLKALHGGDISYVDFLLGRELGVVNKLARGLTMDDTEATWPRRRLDKPWLGAVDSFAIGGGMQLTLVLDRVLAAADSYFSLPAAQEGIVPGAANFRLRRLVGGRLSRQIVLFGRKMMAADPESALFRDAVHEPAELDAAVEHDAALLDNPAVTANRSMLVLAEEPLDEFRRYAAEFALTQALRLYSQDVLSKVARFTAGA